jgi:hypothetical protein
MRTGDGRRATGDGQNGCVAAWFDERGAWGVDRGAERTSIASPSDLPTQVPGPTPQALASP